MNCLKIQAYNELDNIVFDHEMKDNFPVPLSSTLNTSIGDDASIRFTDTTGLNPPDLHVTSQGKAWYCPLVFLFAGPAKERSTKFH